MTDELNPYEAPRTELGAEPEGQRGLAWLLFSFQGRATRWDYWKGTLLLMAGCLVPMLLLFVPLSLAGQGTEAAPNDLAFIVLGVAFFPLFWSSLAIAVKRWHDRNKSGYWMFIGVVPYVGSIWTFVECGCLRGTMGPNSYGPDPLA